MKISFGKRLGAIALAMVLLFGLAPIDARATTICSDGQHIPGNTLYPADWNDQTGGYAYDYYKCTVCGWGCDENGNSHVFVGPNNGCSGGYKCHKPGTTVYEPDYTPCGGGFEVRYYLCIACNRPVDAVGTLVFRTAGTGNHTPGNEKYDANYNPCNGGFQDDFYECTACGCPVDENGQEMQYTPGIGHHTPGSEKHDADYTSCRGGFKSEWYECAVCGDPVDSNGDPMEWFEPTGNHSPGSEKHDANYNPCNGGFQDDFYECTACGCPVDENGQEMQYTPGIGHHTPGSEKHDADYTSCQGGFKSEWYECAICGNPVDSNGDPMEWFEPTGNHTPGNEKYDANYTSCQGGFKSEWYECAICGNPVDNNGDPMEWFEPTGIHTPGSEKCDANYNPCNGGFQDDFYECTACGCPVDENGQEMQYTPGIGHHTPGSEKHDANYTSCQGGFKSEWYECAVCGDPVDSNGDPMEWFEGNGKHTIVQVPGKAPTYEEVGYISFWQCEDCGLAFKDAEGTVIIEDEAEILLPKLEWEETAEEKTDEKTETASRVEVSSGLREVPEGVADQYSSVAEIKEVLIQAALNAEGTFSSETTKSVLLDVELKIQKPNGTWVAVTPENFPAEGVEVLLPYPDGTNKDSYTFVVTHMITTGSKAGQIEVLPCTLEQDGIRVRFTSMSPVVIAYQEKDAGNTAEAPAETPENNPAEATSPQTGDDSNIALWLSILLLSGIGLGYMLFQKKKEQ